MGEDNKDVSLLSSLVSVTGSLEQGVNTALLIEFQ